MTAAEESDAESLVPIPSWREVATSPPVVRRALVYFAVVGSVLIAINHGDALLRGEIDRVRLFKMLLTPAVPYVVSTLSSVSAIRANAVVQRGHRPPTTTRDSG
jgi:hypothetical protein